jgi:hypothetical protein
MRLTGRFLGCLVGSLLRIEFDIKSITSIPIQWNLLNPGKLYLSIPVDP